MGNISKIKRIARNSNDRDLCALSIKAVLFPSAPEQTPRAFGLLMSIARYTKPNGTVLHTLCSAPPQPSLLNFAFVSLTMQEIQENANFQYAI